MKVHHFRQAPGLDSEYGVSAETLTCRRYSGPAGIMKKHAMYAQFIYKLYVIFDYHEAVSLLTYRDELPGGLSDNGLVVV